MKKNKIAIISVTFFLGVVFGVSLIAILAFTRSDSSEPNPTPRLISPDEARTLFNAYYNAAQTITAKPRGYTIDREQLDVLKDLANQYSSTNIPRFRIYMGRDAQGVMKSIVLGVDASGHDFTTGSIWRTDSPVSGPCPFLCDDNSSIIR